MQQEELFAKTPGKTLSQENANESSVPIKETVTIITQKGLVYVIGNRLWMPLNFQEKDHKIPEPTDEPPPYTGACRNGDRIMNVKGKHVSLV